MNYLADPGGVFASDAHRRVMANVPNPDDDPLSVEALIAERVAKDDHLDIDADELGEVLEDLRADGHVAFTKNGYRNTKSGFAALTGPSPGHGHSLEELGIPQPEN